MFERDLTDENRIFEGIDVRERSDGLYDVIRTWKHVHSTGPDLGMIVREWRVVAGVTKEYATALDNEATKAHFERYDAETGGYARKTFGHVGFASRRIGMFAESNPHFAECIKTNVVY